MTVINKRVLINAPCEKVWQVLADFGNVEKWAPTVVKCHCPTEVSSGVGAKRILTTPKGDVTEEVIVEWNEGHDFTFGIPDGLASIVKILRETWSVEHSSNEAIVAVKMDYRTKDGAFNSILDTLVVRRELRKILVQNLAGLKYHIETGEMVTRKTARLPVDAVA